MRIDDFHEFKYTILKSSDVLICALGYENRSYYLLEQNLDTRNGSNTLVIMFDDLDREKIPTKLVNTIRTAQIRTEICSYKEGYRFHDIVITYLKNLIYNDEYIQIFIDYSSMPRGWYCYLPIVINKEFLDKSIEVVLLYVAGNYPASYISYPTAGIDCLKLFYGQSLPKIDSPRTHLVALSYDAIRTQSLLSILEPEFLITCYAYDSIEKKKEIEDINQDIIRRSSASIALPLTDFVQILKKLNGIIFEQTRDGQIVIIPDGPKPLIFAMSILPLLVNIDEGITCLHIIRNERITGNKINVFAKENAIYGVKMSISRTSNS